MSARLDTLASWILASLLACGAVGCRSTPEADALEAMEGRIDVSFEGNVAFGDGPLRAIVAPILTARLSEPPSKATVDDAAFEIELYYLARGFADVRVDYEFREGQPVGATFLITEGAPVVVGELVFDGVTAIPQPELDALFDDVEPGGAFVRSDVASNARALRDRYLDLGYLHATVTTSESIPRADEENPTAKRGARVRVTVEEGPRFRITEVTTPGGLEAFERAVGKLRGAYVGRAYTPRLAYEARSLLVSEYTRAGYADCSVEARAEANEETGEVRLELLVEPGEVVVLSSFEIEGNERTRPSVIRDRIPLEVGERFDAEALRHGVRDLYATGLFESIRIGLDDAEAAESEAAQEIAAEADEEATEREDLSDDARATARKLLIQVVEGPSREVRFEPGYGSYVGPRVVIGLEDKNLFGTARRLSLTGHLSELAKGGRLGVTNSRFLGFPVTLGMSIFADNRVQPSFELDRIGWESVLSRRWRDRYTASLGYTYRVNDLVDVDGVVSSGEEVEEPNVGSLTTSFLYDARDNLLLPTSGTRARLRVSWSDAVLGSELDTLRTDVDLSHIQPLREGLALAGTIRFGVVSPIGDTDVLPIHERLFNGGENTVRSFEESELGPKDALGEAIGGEAFSLVSLELRQDLGGNFGLALFADGGNVVPDYKDTLEFNGYRYAIGIGLRYALPIGPVRVDFGVNPDPGSGEDDWVLHVSVGYPY